MAATVASLAWTLAMPQRRIHACFSLGGWGGCGGTGSADASELLVCERPVDGFSWSPPVRALHADALRELVVVQDVLLQGTFPELLPAGPTARPRVPVWSTQTNRQGDGPLDPHVVKRGSCKVLRRGGALADEAVHGRHFARQKTLLRAKRLKKSKF